MERKTVVYVVLAAVVVCQVRAEVVDLSCSDNATCINRMMREFVRSIRQQKTVRLFDLMTVEPKENFVEGRAKQGVLAKFLNSHAFTFDWDNYQFRLSRPVHRSDAIEVEVFEDRSSAEEPTTVKPEQASKKSDSKESKDEEEKAPKRLRRRQSRKLLQALIPFLFGMKSAGTVMFAMTVVAILTFKAYVASKLALMVTLGMAVKRIYDTFGHGIPAASNVLFNIARYFKSLFGFQQEFSPLDMSPTTLQLMQQSPYLMQAPMMMGQAAPMQM